VPDVGDDDVLVRVRACGICGSDVHGFDGSTGRRIPPLVMGHEAAGTVERVGQGVRELTPGTRVTFDSTVSCGECAYCLCGQINLCDGRRVLGVSCAEYRRHGAFAEFISVPARIVYPLPDRMPFEHAALIEALSVAVHAVGRRPPDRGDTIAIVGCGMIGLLVIQVLKARGCERVIAVDVDAGRRSLAARLGATDAVDASTGDVAQAIDRTAGARGVDHVFEVVGRAETVDAAVRCVRKGGTVTLVGNLAPCVPLPLQNVVTREVSLLGSCASSGEYPQCIDLMACGAVDVGPLISATAPLEEGPVWFDRLHRGGHGLMKVILRP
jgi:threonine dehydrogenase-like Zn-dependent dehydrogenase